MTRDLVIDCNVPSHVLNPAVGLNHNRAKRLLCAFLQTDTTLDIDTEGRLFSEYRWQGLFDVHHELVAEFIKQAFGNGRFQICNPANLGSSQRRRISMLVSDKHDHFLVRLAMAGVSGVLASHDEKAFPRLSRDTLTEELGVSVLDGSEAADFLLGTVA